MVRVEASGILMAGVIEFLLLLLLSKAAGAGLAALMAILILAAIDFFLIRSWPIIAGQIVGFLFVTGIWYILILLGIVR